MSLSSFAAGASGRGRLLVAASVLLVLAPFVPVLSSLLSHPWAPYSLDDDAASLELLLRDAWKGKHLLGAYSRFGWNHPGPLMSYLLGPCYFAAGGEARGLAIGAAVLNGAAAAGAVLVAARLGGPLLALLASFSLSALSFQVAALLDSFWNPHLALFPLVLFLLSAAAAPLRGGATLPVLLFSASFLLQTHVGLAPVTGAVLLVALVQWVRTILEGGSRPDFDRRGRWISLGLGVLLLAWLPPLLQQLFGRPGNLSLMLAFARSNKGAHSFAEVFEPFAKNLGSWPMAVATLAVPSTSDQAGWGTGVFALVLLVGLPLAWRSARGGSAEVRTLSGVALLALVTALFSLKVVVGPLHDYLVVFTFACGCVAWLALAWSLFARLQARWPKGSLAGAACLAILVSALAARANATLVSNRPPRPTLLPVKVLAEALVARLGEPGGAAATFRIGPEEVWVTMAGVLLELDRAGYRFTVQEDWLPMFGYSRRPSGREARTFVFCDEAASRALAGGGGHDVVAGKDGVFLVERRGGPLRSGAGEPTLGPG